MVDESRTINLTRCPYCEDEWVREEMELVCSSCEPKMTLDLTVADLVGSVATLSKSDTKLVEERIDLLVTSYQALGNLIKKVRPKKP